MTCGWKRAREGVSEGGEIEGGRAARSVPVVQRTKQKDREGNLFQRHMAVTTYRSGETLSEGVVAESEEWAGCLTFADLPAVPAPFSEMECEVLI